MMGGLRSVLRSPVALAGGALIAIAAVALIGYRNMPPDPAYITVYRYGYTGIEIAREMLPAAAFGIAGLVAWHRRPRNRIGALMVLIGAAILLKGFQGVPVPPLVSLGIWASIGPGVLASLLLGILILVYPTGRFGSRVDRWWASASVAFFLTVQLAWTGFAPSTRDSTRCPECFPAFYLGTSEYVRLNLRNLSMLIFAVLAMVLVALVARRWARATPPARRVMVPVLLAGVVVAVVAVASSVLAASVRFEYSFAVDSIVPSLGDFLIGRIPPVQSVLPWVISGSMLLVPAALLWGLLRSHLTQSAVIALAIELGRPRGRPPLVDSLRRALGDRTLDLALWSRPARGYVTPDGLPVDLPREDPSRAVTPLAVEEGPLAAIIHDPALSDQRAIHGVAAVAQLAIENERLHAEVRAQLEEVRDTRQRMLSAADDERRRVERNLHDGAQQRLVTLSMALRLARARANDASPSVASTLADAEAELGVAIAELRNLARGIHPAILTEAGLAPALESLADHTPVQVALDAHLDHALSPMIESTAYYIVAEALTNVAKHAAATEATVRVQTVGDRLRIRVADNGAGGADPSHGSGIRGLMDRVSALGGTLRVTTPPAGGTRLEAEIPCV